MSDTQETPAAPPKSAKKQPPKLTKGTVDPVEQLVLSGDDILSGEDQLRAVPVVTPEWQANSRVFVAELSADERDQLETEWTDYKQALDSEDNIGFRAFTVAFCICNAQRVRTFNGRVAEAAEKIGSRNGKATSRLFNTISRINGLTKADIDALEGN